MDIYKEFIINHNLTIPDVKPPMEKLLSEKVEFTITKLQLIDTKLFTTDDPPLPIRKVIVAGVASITVKYVADVPEQSVHGAHFQENFSQLVEWPGGPIPGTELCSDIVQEYLNFYMIDDRTISKTIVAQINISTN